MSMGTENAVRFLDSTGAELKVGDPVVFDAGESVGTVTALRVDGDQAWAIFKPDRPDDYDPDRIVTVQDEDDSEFTLTMEEAFVRFEVECADLTKCEEEALN